MTIESDLAQAHELLDELQTHYERLLDEAAALNIIDFLSTVTLSPIALAGLDDRAQSVVELLRQIDRFVGEVFARVEARALAGDAAAAARLLDSTTRILGAVAGFSIVRDAADDAVDVVRSAVRDAEDIARLVAFVAGGAGVGIVGGLAAGGRGWPVVGALAGGIAGLIAHTMLQR